MSSQSWFGERELGETLQKAGGPSKGSSASKLDKGAIHTEPLRLGEDHTEPHLGEVPQQSNTPQWFGWSPHRSKVSHKVCG